jgi:hypothetical protein
LDHNFALKMVGLLEEILRLDYFKLLA